MKIHEVFAYLCVPDAGAAIDFYQRAFGVHEKFRLTEPSGRIGHAELDFGGTTVMLCDEYPEHGIRSARALGGSPVTIHLHVDDADALLAQAVAAGATLEMPAQDRKAVQVRPRGTPGPDVRRAFRCGRRHCLGPGLKPC